MSGTDHEYAPGGPDTERDPLDGELERALAKYSAVEPRADLEQRILANLHAEQARLPNRTWWRWGVAVAVAATVFVALVVGWRPGNSSRPVVVNHPSTSAPAPNQPPTSLAANGGTKQLRPPRRTTTVRARQPAMVAAASPKLDQFPSPQPLTEQEKILASYVAQFHDQAVLIARVANEELQRDRLEVMGKPQSAASPVGQENPETTIR